MNWFKKVRKAFDGPTHGAEGIVDSPLTNFTPRAQQVLALARKEADRFNHHFLGTEHLLLGLIKLGQGVAVNVLQRLGLDLETVRKEVENQVGTGPDQKFADYVPYTPRVKKVLALACKEAKALNHTYVGTEHILLGLLREGGGVAAKVFQSFGVDIEQTRQEILRELDPTFPDRPNNETKTSSVKETLHMPSETPTPVNPASAGAKPDSIDTNKRYDVYCHERHQELVVYRNARFKGVKKLFQGRPYDFMSEFMELEQADGRIIFLARSSVIKFCEHGVTPSSELVSVRKTAE
jgi:hypothetical protein